MPVVNGIVTERVIEKAVHDLSVRYFRENQIIAYHDEIECQGYPVFGAGYCYIVLFRGEAIGSILHYKTHLCISSYYMEGDPACCN